MSKKCVIGIDIGGTKILTAAADLKGRILSRVRVGTEAKKGPGHVIGQIIRSVVDVLKKAKIPQKNIIRIGVAAPGPVIYEKGIIVSPPNLPGWQRIKLKDRIKKVFKKPVVMDNDANLAALAEALKGAGKGKKNVVYFTISTGIGGGIIFDGRIYRGRIGGAGEVGHMVIQKDGPMCGCGRSGHLEIMGSGTAVANMAKQRASKSSKILKLAGGKRSNITAEVVGEAAKKGDKLARQILRETGENIGIGTANIANILSPDVIILGGGLTNLWTILYPSVWKTFKKEVLEVPGAGVKIVKAKLGGNVGVIGAILFALDPK